MSFVAGRERNRAMDGMYAGYNEQNRVNLLKMVYLYGNNGAGKSKLLIDEVRFADDGRVAL